MSTTESRFVQVFKSWLVSLPHDLKIAFEAMDDENLSREDREMAAGAIMYIVSTKDALKGVNDSVANFADDALLLRLALQRLIAKKDDDVAAFRDRFPEIFSNLEPELEVCRNVASDLVSWLDGKVETLRKREHRGKKIAAYIDNEEEREKLFEDGLRFRTEYPIDESTIGDKLKKASTVTDVMRRRRAEETTRLGAG